MWHWSRPETRRSTVRAIPLFLLSAAVVGCQAPASERQQGIATAPVAHTWSTPSMAKTLQVNGYPMSYWEAGQGPTVVLVHGNVSDFRTFFAQISPPPGSRAVPLAKSFRTVAPSLRRHWPEPWEGKEDDWSLAHHTADLAAFIQQVGAPVDLVGHSRGGLVALQVARARPELVRRLVIAEPPPISFIPREETLDPTRPQMAKTVEQRFAAGDIDGGIATYTDWNAEQEGSWAKLPDPFKVAMRGNAGTVPAAAREVFPRINCEALSSVRMPVLLVNGERSHARSFKTSEALQKCLPQAERMTVANAGHAMHIQNAADFNAGVERFLKR